MNTLYIHSRYNVLWQIRIRRNLRGFSDILFGAKFASTLFKLLIASLDDGGSVDDGAESLILYAGDAVSTPTMSSLRTTATKSLMTCLLRCHQDFGDAVLIVLLTVTNYDDDILSIKI